MSSFCFDDIQNAYIDTLTINPKITDIISLYITPTTINRPTNDNFADRTNRFLVYDDDKDMFEFIPPVTLLKHDWKCLMQYMTNYGFLNVSFGYYKVCFKIPKKECNCNGRCLTCHNELP